ncbi:peroxiredoxin family protein, partial [Bacteroidota bacterium]
KCHDLPQYHVIKDSIDNELHQIYLNQQQFVKENIDKNLNEFGALFAFYIYQKFGNLEIFTEEEKFRYTEMLDSTLLPKFSKNTHLLEHHERLVKMRKSILEEKLSEDRLQLGKKVPDIEMNDTAGNPVKLSQLMNKIIYLNFWSAGCGKCRQENLKITNLYNNYNKKGFEIYSVFVGSSKELWTAAINIDKINWIQVSDLNPQSSIIKLFNLPDDIYRSFLLDDGIIIAQNPKLEELEKILENKLN